MYLVYLVILSSSHIFCGESEYRTNDFNRIGTKITSNDEINKDICKYTYPKTGSGLIGSALREVLKIKGRLLDEEVDHRHFIHDNSDKILLLPYKKTVMILRDPRDTALSFINFGIIKNKRLLRQGIDVWEKHTGLSYEELITNYFESVHFKKLYCSYRFMLECMDLDNVCVLQFEKLLGAAGGGRDEDRDLQVMKLAKFLDINISDEELKEICQNIYGRSWTFFKGKIGKYKTTFNKHQIDTIEEELGDLIEPLSKFYDFTR